MCEFDARLANIVKPIVLCVSISEASIGLFLWSNVLVAVFLVTCVILTHFSLKVIPLPINVSQVHLLELTDTEA